MKRKIFKWLSAMLTVVMLMGLIVLPVSASGCNGNHSWGDFEWVNGTSCLFGPCEIFQRECSVCGAREEKVWRSQDGRESEMTLTDRKGDHVWGVSESYPSECDGNPTVEKRCSICNVVETIRGGHVWEPYGEPVGGNKCVGGGTQTYKCKYCQETREEKLPLSGEHDWEDVETVQPTCTENGYQIKRCRVCQTEIRVPTGMLATGHRWVNDDDTCGSARHCEKCNETAPATGHDFSSKWFSNSSVHWQQCRNCSTKINEYPHDFVNGKCDTCGYTQPAQSCRHNWEVGDAFYLFNHYETCSLCGETRLVSCASAGKEQPRTYCTDPTYCQCGNIIKDGQKRHNFGTWICHDDSHEHKCLNSNCSYTTKESHSFVTMSGIVKCSVCKYIDEARSAAHVHTNSKLMHDASGHWYQCECGYKQAVTPHTAGTADCTGHAVCTVCGASVTASANPSNHVGGTVVKDAKAAQVGVPGYTGDTYCLSCGQIVTPGKAIEALSANHTHSYTKVASDTSGHWYQCECGAKQAVSAHTGGSATCSTQAKCSVCGQSYGPLNASRHLDRTRIEDAVAATAESAGYTGDKHCAGCGVLIEKGTEIPALTGTHTHNYVLKNDGVSHWQECSVCGNKKDVTEHTYVEGICSVCGDDEPEEMEVHVHSFSAAWFSDGTNHWHECETCGSRTDEEPHHFNEDKCGCGMTYRRYEGLALVDQDKAAALEKLKGSDNVVTTFSDVNDTAWYKLEVQRLNDYNLMMGTGETTFGVGVTASRIQIMIILARLNGVQGTSSTDDWDEQQLAAEDWVAKNEIAEPGSRNEDISRSELVLMLWRNAGKIETDAELDGFKDAASLEGETLEAMKWAVSNDIVQGNRNSDGTLSIYPDNSANRSEIAALLVRYIDATAGDIIDISKL